MKSLQMSSPLYEIIIHHIYNVNMHCSIQETLMVVKNI